MQLHLYLYFCGSFGELKNLVISFLEKKGIEYKEWDAGTIVSAWFAAWFTPENYSQEYFGYLREEYQVTVNNEISFQLYPGCDEEMFSGFIGELLEKTEGDLFFNGEFDELILLRGSGGLHIEKERWKGYFQKFQ